MPWERSSGASTFFCSPFKIIVWVSYRAHQVTIPRKNIVHLYLRSRRLNKKLPKQLWFGVGNLRVQEKSSAEKRVYPCGHSIIYTTPSNEWSLFTYLPLAIQLSYESTWGFGWMRSHPKRTTDMWPCFASLNCTNQWCFSMIYFTRGVYERVVLRNFYEKVTT